MRKETVGKEAVARVCIEADLAKSVVDLISQEWKPLQQTLAALGIITRAEGTGHMMVNVDKVRNYVVRHCVVMCGHYPTVSFQLDTSCLDFEQAA